MEIELIELKRATDRLFDHIVNVRGAKTVEITTPYYWNIPTNSLRDMDEDPDELDIGNLADDWEFLSSLLDDANAPVTYQLTQLAPLLRFVGETLGKELAKHGG